MAAADIPVKDFRGAPEPSADEQAKLEALRADDERARRAEAATRNRPLYTLPPPAQLAKLSSGHAIPLVGLGTWKSQRGEVRAAVLEAVRAGYRHIDAASIYGNEHEVGEALALALGEGVVGRGELFVTSKLWNSDHGSARAACVKTLRDLQLEYLDLYLIHWPHSGRAGAAVDPPLSETWAALEALVDEGLVKSIGVSNFSAKKLAALLGGARVKPAVLQIEAHPYWRNQALVDWATANGVHVTAYAPLGSPDSAAIVKRASDAPGPMRDAAVLRIAEKLGRSPAQVLIRWAVQRGTSVLPKSVHPERIRANLDVFSWELAPEDFAALSRLEPQMRMVPGDFLVDAENGPYRSRAELWDGE